jgi:Cys-tRNA(Pro) deacylase
VSAFLRKAGAEARIEEFPAGAATAQDAADAVGCDLGRIVKSLVFVCDNHNVIAMVPGDRKADAAKIAQAVGAERAKVADAERVVAATGFEPGAVAPFPLRAVTRVLIERTLLTHDVVWVGAGSSRHMAGLPPSELVRLAGAQPLDLVRDD